MKPNNLHKLIVKYGKDLTLTKQTTSGSYNPATGSFDGSVDTTSTVKGYFYTNVNGSFGEVTTGKRMVAISGLSEEPVKGSYLSGYNDEVRIGPVQPILSGDTTVVYLCEVEE